MNPSEIDPFLKETLADRQISKSEKKSLSDWIASYVTDDNKRAFVRHRAFAIAQEAMVGQQNQEVLNWLEEVVKSLSKSEAIPPTTVESQAFFSPGIDCIGEVTRQIKSAQQSCDLCIFTITDDRITRVILDTHDRGVPVRVITDDDKSHDLGSDIDLLKRAGIPCKMDRSPFHMHHKFAIFDRKRLLTGSFNWTRSATDNNEENLIVTNDPKLANAFYQRFEKLWANLENA
jgi:cardiolipin hydrolase